jgi:hypothetical protein
MSPEQLRNTLRILSTIAAQYRYIGIAPLRDGEADSGNVVATVLASGPPTVNALAAALDDAGEMWPDAAAWQLVGSDEALSAEQQTLAVHSAAGWPASARVLRECHRLATLCS